MRRIAAGAAAFVALSTAGCGATEPSVPDRLTACEVVSATDVRLALGQRVLPPAPGAEGSTDRLAGRSGCAWSSASGDMAVLVELVRTGDMARSVRRTGFSATARYQAAVAQQPTGVAEDGLGDRAWYLEEAAKLWVLQRDDLVTLEVAVPDPGRARSVAVELAAAAVRRLRDDDRAD